MLELSILAIIAQLVSIIHNMVDRIFIGRISRTAQTPWRPQCFPPVITLITAVTRLQVGERRFAPSKWDRKPERGGGDPGHRFGS